MKITFLFTGLLALALAFSCSQLSKDEGAASLGEARPPGSGIGLDGDEPVPLDQVPVAVMNAALKAVPGMTIEEAEAEVEEGVLIYALSGTSDGEQVEVDVTADGQVLEVETGEEDPDPDGEEDDGEEDEEDENGESGDEAIPVSQVPALVLNAALAAAPGLVVESAEIEHEDGVTIYCLQGTAGGEAVEVDVTATGEVLEVEQDPDEGSE